MSIRYRLLCAILELLGVCVVSVGLGIELAMKADVGYMLITAGSLLLAGGGMVYAKFIR